MAIGNSLLLCILFFGSPRIPYALQHRDTKLNSFSAASSSPLCPSRSAWYGISAYPTVDGRVQSWSWLLAFVQSVENSSSDDAAAWHRIIKETTNDGGLPFDSVRFPGVLLSGFEKHIFEQANQERHVWNMSRTECFKKLCDKENHLERSMWSDQPKIAGDVVFLDFRDVDVDGIEQVIKKLARTSYIVMSCIAEFRDALYDEDIVLALYDLLNKMYFLWDWVPLLSDIGNCRDITSGSCHFWLVWKRWSRPSRLSYIPPAGPGTLEYEVQRLAALVNRPHTDTCSCKRRIGGQWEYHNFVDGQWTICLDQLKKIVSSGSCIVYSFGIANDWSFDDAMHEIGCRVYSFDPSTSGASYQRNKSHWFYNWGIENGAEHDSNWTLLSFDEIRRRLGHESQRITILKMDVEGAEWTFLNSSTVAMDLADIDQFLLEVHISAHAEWPNDVRGRSRLVHAIEKHGFALFNARLNPAGVNLRAYTHTKSVKTSPDILVELSYMRCSSRT